VSRIVICVCDANISGYLKQLHLLGMKMFCCDYFSFGREGVGGGGLVGGREGLY
jgi:hypothetical protein